jgi:UDP-N-acetylmuramyl pentapeptide phosphotransferase/UDP-N-acetylglucosamine-1-phosphate transferase
VPAVGGAGILVGLGAIEAWTRLPALGPGAWVALLLAFGLGLCDDRIRGGLPPIALLLGQAIVALALVASGWRVYGGEPVEALAASVLAVLVAVNAVNTFDNADGAATAIGILGFSFGSFLFAAPLLGFLPWNLLSRPLRPGGPVPVAYLGNSGSQVLGVLLLLDPIGRAALLLPLLDLVRLSFVRFAAGSRPWIGDRRHLAHRLQKAGCSRALVVIALVAIAAPFVLGAAASRAQGTAASLALGASCSILLFGAAVRLSPRIE